MVKVEATGAQSQSIPGFAPDHPGLLLMANVMAALLVSLYRHGLESGAASITFRGPGLVSESRHQSPPTPTNGLDRIIKT